MKTNRGRSLFNLKGRAMISIFGILLLVGGLELFANPGRDARLRISAARAYIKKSINLGARLQPLQKLALVKQLKAAQRHCNRAEHQLKRNQDQRANQSASRCLQ